jgi:hypothetical protein
LPASAGGPQGPIWATTETIIDMQASPPESARAKTRREGVTESLSTWGLVYSCEVRTA